jgi:hypothetical protein
MTGIDRRSFLRIAGIGTVAAGVVGAPALQAAASPTKAPSATHGIGAGGLNVHAAAGLPAPPLPAYATQAVEGALDLGLGTGVLTSRLVAGHPGANSEIALPGLSRILRVTKIQKRGQQLKLNAVVDDRSQLRPGEDPYVDIEIDFARSVMRYPLGGHVVHLDLKTSRS